MGDGEGALHLRILFDRRFEQFQGATRSHLLGQPETATLSDAREADPLVSTIRSCGPRRLLARRSAQVFVQIHFMSGVRLSTWLWLLNGITDRRGLFESRL